MDENSYKVSTHRGFDALLAARPELKELIDKSVQNKDFVIEDGFGGAPEVQIDRSTNIEAQPTAPKTMKR